MKTAAIIAEYNPFHNGHAYQLSEIRRRSGADFVIILLSGDFVQRGTPAVFDKYIRTEAALKNGADLVLELPVPFATGSARRFAEGAVSILNGLGIVDELWFGSEEGEEKLFSLLSDILFEEPEEYQKLLRSALKSGLSYPVARSNALCAYCRDSHIADQYSPETFLREPNNILGLEYAIALKKYGSAIRLRTMKRMGNGYHDSALNSSFSSATAIRSAILDGKTERICSCVPANCYSIYKERASEGSPVSPDQFSEALNYQLWKESAESLCNILDINQELANRIIHLRSEYKDFLSFAELLQTRNQTCAAMQRALLHILLGITWEDAGVQNLSSKERGIQSENSNPEQSILSDKHRLVRMLGLSKAAAKAGLLSGLSDDGPVILTANPGTHPLHTQYEKDLFASQLYESVKCLHSKETFIPEYSRKLILR